MPTQHPFHRAKRVAACFDARPSTSRPMKPFPLLCLLAVAAFSPPAPAAEPTAQPSVLGAWSVDTSRLPMPPAHRPQRVTLTFSAEGPDRLRTQVEIVDPSGARRGADGVTPLDGKATPLVANFEADVSSTLMPRPDVLIMQLGLGGQPGSTRIYTVSADGQTMVETVAAFSRDGQPVLRKNHFSRLR